MKPVAVLLRDEWADWESGYLLGAVGFFLGTRAAIATPQGATVRSAGGMRASADVSIETLVPSDYSAIVLIGAPAWLESEPSITNLLLSAEKAALPIGAICAGTVPLARAGLLDRRSHTSNGVGYLDGHAREYRGADRYKDSSTAIVDRGVVTAPGTAPSTFAVSLLRLASPSSETVLQGLLALSAREHGNAGSGSPA